MANPLGLLLVLSALAAYRFLPLALAWRTSQRAGRRCVRRARAALLDPREDLDAVENDLHRELDALEPIAQAPVDPVDDRGKVRRARGAEMVGVVRVARAAIAIERGDADLARAELVGIDADRGLRRLLKARLALLAGRRLERVQDGPDAPELAELHTLLLADTQAQLALARGDHSLALRRGVPILASTRLRALAAAGRREQALALKAQLRPERYATICRLFPNEPVARLLTGAIRGDPSPYR